MHDRQVTNVMFCLFRMILKKFKEIINMYVYGFNN